MFKEINTILGERIKACRKANGYTRETFAEIISISPRFLADLEIGKVGVSISTLKNIALNLNVSTDYLLGITDLEEDDLIKKMIIAKLDKVDKNNLTHINTILDCIINISK